jgi:hypothetical protein
VQVSEQRGLTDSADGARLHLVEVEWRAGRWAQAAEHAAAVDLRARRTGNEQPGVSAYAVSLIAAARGEVARARTIAEGGVRAAEAHNDLTFAAQCRFVLGHLALSLDDPTTAVTWLHPLAEPFRERGFGEPAMFPFPPDLIEAYARVGRLVEATDLLTWLQDTAQRLDHPWARITSRRAAAVLHMANRDPQAALDPAATAVTEARDTALLLELGRCLRGARYRHHRHQRAAAHSRRKLEEVMASCSPVRCRPSVPLPGQFGARFSATSACSGRRGPH